jgi:hypothetical protein
MEAVEGQHAANRGIIHLLSVEECQADGVHKGAQAMEISTQLWQHV